MERLLFQLRKACDPDEPLALPVGAAHHLVVAARDAAVERLMELHPDGAAVIAAALVGRHPDGSWRGGQTGRVRILPLPTIGYFHADFCIRHLLVEVPPSCSLTFEEVAKGFSGLVFSVSHLATSRLLLLPAQNPGILLAYGIGTRRGSRLWQTVTPLVLPSLPGPGEEKGKLEGHSRLGGGPTSHSPQGLSALRHALRHAGVSTPLARARFQGSEEEPGRPAIGVFADGTRFSPDRFRYAELVFNEPVRGPLVLGDGRFLGLGVLAPRQAFPEAHTFQVEAGLTEDADPQAVARAFRRAVMALVGQHFPDQPLPVFFSGHEPDGRPARRELAGHLAFAFEPQENWLLVVPPHLLERRPPTPRERSFLRILNQALGGLKEIKAGDAGVLTVRRCQVPLSTHPLLGPSSRWLTVTPYRVNRHLDLGGALEAILADLRLELERSKLPPPESVAVTAVEAPPGKGLQARIELRFSEPLLGPCLFGRDRHLGGGLFRHAAP